MPNIDGFRAVASTSLQGNIALDANAQTGIKNSDTSFMGRVVTWFQDIGKGSATQIQSNRKTMDAFIQTIANEKGQQYADLASALLHGARDRGQPLKGYMVTSVLNALDMEVSKVKQFNAEILGRFITNDDPRNNPNCLESLFASVISEKGSTINPKSMLNPVYTNIVKEHLQTYIREQTEANDRQPVSVGAVRSRALEKIGELVDFTQSKLTELDTLATSPQESTWFRNQILSGLFDARTSVSVALSEKRINDHMDSNFKGVLQGAIAKLSLPGEANDYSCANLQQDIRRGLSDDPDCQTKGLSNNKIEAYVKEKVDTFMTQKKSYFNLINVVYSNTAARAGGYKAVMNTELFSLSSIPDFGSRQ